MCTYIYGNNFCGRSPPFYELKFIFCKYLSISQGDIPFFVAMYNLEFSVDFDLKVSTRLGGYKIVNFSL